MVYKFNIYFFTCFLGNNEVTDLISGSSKVLDFCVLKVKDIDSSINGVPVPVMIEGIFILK